MYYPHAPECDAIFNFYLHLQILEPFSLLLATAMRYLPRITP